MLTTFFYQGFAIFFCRNLRAFVILYFWSDSFCFYNLGTEYPPDPTILLGNNW
ncbi:hypothetical protein FP744_10005833 [Trichoderma asperellum]|nr:hypothetical protein LI328DRAFT_142220 [Trichoderma asperelloides]